MEDLGEQTSYLALGRNVPVFSSDGERLGRVVRVLREAKVDMFDGIIFDTTAGPGGHRFVDAPEVGEIYERGVVLKIDAAEAAKLPKPTANQAAASGAAFRPLRRFVPSRGCRRASRICTSRGVDDVSPSPLGSGACSRQTWTDERLDDFSSGWTRASSGSIATSATCGPRWIRGVPRDLRALIYRFGAGLLATIVVTTLLQHAF